MLLDGEYETALADEAGANPPRLIVVQHDVRLKLEPVYGALHQMRVLKQGDNCLSFFSGAGDPPP